MTPVLFNGPSRYPELSPFLSGPFVAWAIHRKSVGTMAANSSPTDVAYRSGAARHVFAHSVNVPSSIIPAYHSDVSSVAGNEGEPALTAFSNSYGTFTVQSYQQGDATHQFHITAASTTDPQSGTFTKTTPYIPASYTDAFDTMLSVNPYTDTDGVRPGGMYLTSLLAYSTAAGQPVGNPMQVRAE
jgi:hypothetical protein